MEKFQHPNFLLTAKLITSSKTFMTILLFLNEMFGPRYVVIGSAVGESPVNGIGQPEAGTLENLLTTATGPVRFIPTHQGQGLPTSVIATLPIRTCH